MRKKGMKRNNKALLAVALVLSGIIVGSVFFASYPGGWEVKNYLNYVNANGHRYLGQSYTNSVNAYGTSSITIDTSGGEVTYFGSVACPSGSPDVQITMSAVRHVILSPSTGGLLETVDYKAHVEDIEVPYTASDGSKMIYYGEVHYYAFEITFRTLAECYNRAGTFGLGDVHEGNVAGSYGTEVNPVARVVFEIDPWVITQGYESISSGSDTYDYRSGFSGILMAKVWSTEKGAIPNQGDQSQQGNCGGYVKGTYTVNTKLNTYIGENMQGQVNWQSAGISGLPSNVDIEINGGQMLADAFSGNMPIYRWTLQPRDVFVQYTVVVQVLQARNYELRTGEQGEQETPTDWWSNIQTFWDQLFGSFGFWIIVGIAVVVGIIVLISITKITTARFGRLKR